MGRRLRRIKVRINPECGLSEHCLMEVNNQRLLIFRRRPPLHRCVMSRLVRAITQRRAMGSEFSVGNPYMTLETVKGGREVQTVQKNR